MLKPVLLSTRLITVIKWGVSRMSVKNVYPDTKL